MVGIALLPVWAAIGAIAALVSDCTILVEKGGEQENQGSSLWTMVRR